MMISIPYDSNLQMTEAGPEWTAKGQYCGRNQPTKEQTKMHRRKGEGGLSKAGLVWSVVWCSGGT